jgi:hypothetical protein
VTGHSYNVGIFLYKDFNALAADLGAMMVEMNINVSGVICTTSALIEGRHRPQNRADQYL